MDFLNLQVKHNVFGEGTVISQNGKYFTVAFNGCQKNFVYPDAFEKFLTMTDGTVPENFLNDLKATKEAKNKILEKKQAETRHSMMHGIVIPGKEIVNDPDGEDSRFKNSENDEA